MVPSAGAPAVRRRGRTILVVVAAVALLALAVGLPTLDSYLTYKADRPDDIVHVVEPGQPLAFEHVSWQANVSRFEVLPEGLAPATAGRTWMQIIVTRVALDTEGAQRSYEPTLEMRDAEGRGWRVEITGTDVPLEAEDNKVGVEYRYNAISLVPEPVAERVELYLRPSVSRRDQPAAEVLQPTEESNLDVLRFKR
jgi:hypothetical protein